MDKCTKLNVIALPVKLKCSIAWSSPKPFIAPGMVVISGQAASISFWEKINSLLLSDSSDNFESWFTILLQGSGKLPKSGIMFAKELPNLARFPQIVRKMKRSYKSVEFFGRMWPLLYKKTNTAMLKGIKHKLLILKWESRYWVSSLIFSGRPSSACCI